jgi:hypothetical protein
MAFAALSCALLLPESARALSGQPSFANLGQGQQGVPSSSLYNPAFLFAPNIEWAVANPWTTPTGGFAASRYRSAATPAGDDVNSFAFDIGRYDAMWDDTLFSEIAAYGGLNRDLQMVANMQAMGGSDGAGGIPYGRLTLQREFLDGQHHIALGAYGLHVNVRPTAISGFGGDGYTDVALDGTWRWIAHPERRASDTISAHLLILHEDESLIASQAVFGTARNDELTVFRGDVSYAWGAAITPAIQFFQITGTSDPVRLGTLDGSPDSKGWIAEMDYTPKPDSSLARLNVRFALRFIAYSEFDGASRNASDNNTVLLHVTLGADPD